jgi:hypothetical protein
LGPKVFKRSAASAALRPSAWLFSAPAPHQRSADMRGVGDIPEGGIIWVDRFGQNIFPLKFREAESLESFRANEKNFKKAGDNLNLHSI